MEMGPCLVLSSSVGTCAHLSRHPQHLLHFQHLLILTLCSMYEPIRGGTRGGQAEFKWADVSADKDREVRSVIKVTTLSLTACIALSRT